MTVEPRILLYDIETAPLLGWTWKIWETNIIRVEIEWYILSVAWKWLDETKVHVLGLPGFERYANNPEDDYDLVAKIHELMSEADIVVGHNSNQFDNRKVQSRMLLHQMDPPSPYKEIDTLKIARRHFAFTSNKLGDLCEVLGIGSKHETGGFSTWLGCIRGDEKSWARMLKYNKQDVRILEELFLKLRPWATGLPNLATIADRPNACPRCGSTEGMIARGHNHNSVTRRTKYQCRKCRGYCSGRKIERTETSYV